MATAEIKSIIDDATADSSRGAAGIVFEAVDRNGKVVNATASGVRGLNNANSMTMDTTFWIASLTKLVTSIALMQFVEEGRADLDSEDQVERILPEMRDIKIIDGVDADGNEQLRPKKNRITLRMLQTHTSGFSYTFFNNKLWRRTGENPDKDEFQCTVEGIKQPLLFEPGTSRAYGIGIDWVGIFIERVSGLTLDDYFQTYIFGPLGIQNMGFIPNAKMRSSLATMHARDPDGTLSAREHLIRTAKQATGASVLHSGGAGLMGNAPDFCRILAMLLNNGISPHTSERVLAKSTVDLMFTNQMPNWRSEWAEVGEQVSREDLAAPSIRDPPVVTTDQGWGLNFLLLGDNLQRGYASGLCNSFWIVDREKGVGGILLSQILPFGDPVIAKTFTQVQDVLFR